MNYLPGKRGWAWSAMLVLGLAAFLRIYHLNIQGLWGDEGWSVEFSEPRAPWPITQNLVDDLHPPLYFILLGAWREIAGSTEVAMRLLAVFPALISVALVIRLGRKLFSPGAGLWAGMILALADKHILLSQEVRHYPLAFMWMAASSLVYLDWLEKPTRRRSLIYALITVASLYTHYYTSLIFVVQMLYALMFLRPWRRVGQWIVLCGVACLTFLPWLPVAIHQLRIRPEGILHSMPRNRATLDFFMVDFLGRPVFLGLALLILGMVQFQRKETGWRVALRGGPAGWYPVLWLGFPIALTLAIYDYVTLLTDRNMALLLLPIALLIGQGITAFRAPAQYILAGLVLMNGLTSLDSWYDHPPWREMSAYVAINYPPDESVLMDVRGGDKALGYHLRQDLPADTQIISLNQWRLDHKVYFLSVLHSFLEENTGFWVAYWGDPPYELNTVFEEHGFTRTASHSEYHLGHPIEWYHYDRVPPLSQRLGSYAETISLHQVKAPTAGHRGDSLTISLWWSTNTRVDISYSVSVFLLDADGVLRAQHDGPPQNGASPTNTWPVNEIILDTHAVSIPTNLPAGAYDLAVKIYNSADLAILPAIASHPDVSSINHEYLMVGKVYVR